MSIVCLMRVGEADFDFGWTRFAVITVATASAITAPTLETAVAAYELTLSVTQL